MTFWEVFLEEAISRSSKAEAVWEISLADFSENNLILLS
jgi:hypothetical protein